MPYIIDNKLWIFISKNTSNLTEKLIEIRSLVPVNDHTKDHTLNNLNTMIHQADKIVIYQLQYSKDDH